MKIDVEQAGTILVLRLEGRLDVVWADHVAKRVRDELRGGHHNVRINAAELNLEPLVKPHWRLQPMPPISNYPPVVEDLAFEVAEEVTAQALIQIRFPRVIMSALVGAALAVAGAVMQSIFGNPLAEPGVVGVSSGAALGAATGIVLGGAAAST